MTRTTRQFPPSSSGVLQTRHMGLIRSPTDTKRNDVLGCCFFVLSVMEIRLRSVTENIGFVKEASFLVPQKRVWIRLGSFVRTITDIGRQKIYLFIYLF